MFGKKSLSALLIAAMALLFVPLGASAAPPTGSITQDVTGVLSDGGTFDGTLDITELSRDGTQLLASGTLEGTATDAAGVVTDVSQSFTDTLVSLTQAGNGNGRAACDILNLDLGPLDLNLLGLQVDLAQVVLDITGVPGPGNLLGNLLCAVTGLLDGPGLLGQIGNVLDNLLGRITGLLG